VNQDFKPICNTHTGTDNWSRTPVRGHETKEGSGHDDPLWENILGEKLGRKTMLGMSGAEFLTVKVVVVVSLYKTVIQLM
jgi:hypothetical protein